MNSNEYKVLNLIERENRPLFFREISKKSNVSIGGTQKVLKDFFDFLDKKIEGRNTYYFFREGILKFYLKKLIEIERAIRFHKKNIILKDFFMKMIKNNIPCIVFGSYANNINKETSDLDLIILSEDKLSEHLCPVELHIIRSNKKEFLKSLKNKESLSKEILKNHVIINDMDYFLEAFSKYEKN